MDIQELSFNSGEAKMIILEILLTLAFIVLLVKVLTIIILFPSWIKDSIAEAEIRHNAFHGKKFFYFVDEMKDRINLL